MSEPCQRFDAANYLDDMDDVAGYLQIALEESGDDPTAVPRALGVIARAGNMSEPAHRVGMSRDGPYKALSDQGNPTWSTVLKVSEALSRRLSFQAVACLLGRADALPLLLRFQEQRLPGHPGPGGRSLQYAAQQSSRSPSPDRRVRGGARRVEVIWDAWHRMANLPPGALLTFTGLSAP